VELALRTRAQSEAVAKAPPKQPASFKHSVSPKALERHVMLTGDGKGIHARRSATLGDLLPYLDKVRTSRSRTLIASRTSDGGHILRWADLRNTTRAEEREGHAIMRELVGRLANGSPPGSPLHQIVRACVETIDATPNLDQRAISELALVNSEHIHQSAMSALSGAPINKAESPRPTSSCMAHWLDVVDSEVAKTRRTDTKSMQQLHEITQEARTIWLAHTMTPAEIIPYFGRMGRHCEAIAMHRLSECARYIEKETINRSAMKQRFRSESAIDGNTAMRAAEYDNPMARAFDTALGHYLYVHPPKEMLNAADAFAQAHHDRMQVLARTKPHAFAKVAESIQEDLLDNARFWMDRLEHFSQFLEAGPAERGQRLLDYLDTQIRNSDGCLAIYLTNTEIARALQYYAPDHMDWDIKPKDREDYETLSAARDRQRSTSPDTPCSGVMLRQHPLLAKDPFRETDSYKSAAESRPGMATPTPENNMLLESGLVYASGPSGVAGMVAKAVDKMNQDEGVVIDRQHAMLGAYTAVYVDGGHSLNGSGANGRPCRDVSRRYVYLIDRIGQHSR